MRTMYYGIAGGVLLAALAIIGWKKRVIIQDSYRGAVPRARGMANRMWGRSKSVVDNTMHTERDDQPYVSAP